MSYVSNLATKYALDIRQEARRKYLEFDAADAEPILERALNECCTKCAEIVDKLMDPYSTAEEIRELRARL